MQLDQVIAHLGDDKIAHIGRHLGRLALEAWHDGSRIEFSIAHQDRHLPAPVFGPAVAMVHAVVIEALAIAPYQGALVQFDVIAELESDEGPAEVLPDEQVEVIALEPPAPERRVVLLDDEDLSQHRSLGVDGSWAGTQALSFASSARAFTGSCVRKSRAAGSSTSRTRVRRTCCLIASSCAGCIENSRSPKPSRRRVMAASPAISPHTATGVLACFAPRMVCAMSCSTAGCSGSYRCATVSSVRSIASVYWIRSLVPIERKSSLRTKYFKDSAAAGTSIMPPIWMRRS